MANNRKNFLSKLIIFTLIVGFVGYGIWWAIPATWRTPVFPFLVVFFFAITLLMHLWLFRSPGERFVRFANRYMIITFLKIMVFLMIILGYVLLVDRSDAIPFTVTFFVLYLVFTVFEVIEVLKAGKAQDSSL